MSCSCEDVLMSLSPADKRQIRDLVRGRIEHYRHLNGDVSREKLALLRRHDWLQFADVDLGQFGVPFQYRDDVLIWFTVQGEKNGKRHPQRGS